MPDSKRLKLISCEVFHREMCATAARSPNQVDLAFLPKGLHDLPSDEMLGRLQAAVDDVKDPDYDAVLLGYGLCNNGLRGLRARTLPVVVPRAHDCITLFFGSRERYLDYFNQAPGTYFKTSGWIERGAVSDELSQLTIQRRMGLDASYQELVEKYGEDNAAFLHQTLGDHARNYSRLAYIEMGIEPDDRFERQARDDAESRGWAFHKVRGDLGLIARLVSGPWDDHTFLVLNPGHRLDTTHDERIIEARRD